MREVWLRFKQNHTAMAGAVIVVMFLLTTLLSSWLAPHDPTRQDLLMRLAGPSLQHPLGHGRVLRGEKEKWQEEGEIHDGSVNRS